LGVPGLINAYKSATIDALRTAEIIELTLNDVYMISFNYLQMNDVMKIIKDYGLTILHQRFENTCDIELEIPKSLVNTVIAKLEKINVSALTYLRTQ
jgi:putative IMPACT (imprinted ancient) family translation regulator